MSASHSLLDRSKAALLVIDVQERINGVMADQGHLSRLTTLIDGCSALKIPVIATEQYPKGLGDTVGELLELLPDRPIIKDTFSCMREPAASAAITGVERQQIIVTGIETHVCVLQTVVDLLDEGFQVHVPHDGVNSRRPTDKDWALHRMLAAGAIVTSTESALFELLEVSGTDDFRTVSELIREIPV
jgi:nicotinamidase-related amidase